MESTARLSVTDRLLRLFTEVRAGESKTVLLLTLNVFLILTAYYFVKPVREALILDSGTAELKSYLAAGQAILLLGAVPAYGWLANRMPRRPLINVVTFFFVACLGGFFFAAQLGAPLLVVAIIFFLWVGIFNLMIVAQFWSFANDVYSREEGERLFPIVAFGASAGAVFGSFVAANVIEWLSVYPPLLFAGGVLLASLLITNFVDAAERRRAAGAGRDGNPKARSAESARQARESAESKAEGEAGSAEGGTEPSEEEVLGSGANPFILVIRCRYLLLIAFLILFLNWVNTTGEYILGSVVEDAAATAVAAGTAGGLTQSQFIGRFYSNFFGVVNGLALFIQLFLVSRIIKYLGVRIALLILPIIALGGYTLLVFYPLLAYVRWAKTAENATDYSLQNTVRHALFLPCTREQKYKAKQAIDSFFWRAGDVLSAVVVFVGTTYLAMQTGHFAAFNIGLVAMWLILAVLIGREYKKLTTTGSPPCPTGEQLMERRRVKAEEVAVGQQA